MSHHSKQYPATAAATNVRVLLVTRAASFCTVGLVSHARRVPLKWQSHNINWHPGGRANMSGMTTATMSTALARRRPTLRSHHAVELRRRRGVYNFSRLNTKPFNVYGHLSNKRASPTPRPTHKHTHTHRIFLRANLKVLCVCVGRRRQLFVRNTPAQSRWARCRCLGRRHRPSCRVLNELRQPSN